MRLINGECLEEMAKLEAGSIDLILIDLFCRTTQLEPMWEQLERIMNPNGAIAMTVNQPFAPASPFAFSRMFNYEFIWRKDRTNPLLCRTQPTPKNIAVFCNKQPTYNGPMFPKKEQHKPRAYNHQTKIVPLMEYFIKTYTNEGETVLDFTMGSGATGVACKNLNRNFIGTELEERIENATT